MGESYNTIEFRVADYDCIARALTVGEFDSLAEGALPFSDIVTTEDKEKVILACLQSPTELIELIKEGSIEYGIPELVFQLILQYSGFYSTKEEREQILNEKRNFLKSDVVSSCEILILASGLMNLEDLKKLTFLQLLEKVALSEAVLRIHHDNIFSAVNGGDALCLTWDVESNDEESQLKQVHEAKQAEVQALLDSQTMGRGGPGIRRL